jgi:hypothetical protein
MALVPLLALALAACGGASATLGGRETCWSASDPRAASLWRGILRVERLTASLDTPEGDRIPVLPGGPLRIDPGRGLTRGAELMAAVGDDVTLFGGAGADGVLVACAVEANRGPA